MSDPQTNQPGHKPPMSTTVGELGTEFAKGAAEEGGSKAVEYGTSEQGQQQLEDAKAQAQGLWAKYCGCLSA